MRNSTVSAIVPGVALLFAESVAVAQMQPQSVIGSQAPQQPFASQWQQDQPSEWDVFSLFNQVPDKTVPDIFRYGPITLRPHLNYRFFFGNGILATPGNTQATAVNEISPGLRMDIGKHWSLDYTPTLDFYSSSQFKNTVNHSIALTGGEEIGDWKVGFSHASQFTQTPLIQTGTQTEQQSHNTGISASHFFTDKTSTDISLAQQINLVSGFENSYGWSTLDWLNYQFWPRLSAGAGVGAGYVKNDDESAVPTTSNLDQTYEQLQARINWRATQKVSFQISGGVEDRQFMTPGTGDSINPIFAVTIQYQPWKSTEILLTAGRSVSTSDYYLAAQEADLTSVSLNINQHLFKKFTLGASVAYGKTDYSTTGGAVILGANRSDDVWSFNLRLSRPFLKHGIWTIFYQYSDDTSTLSGFSFTSNQGGFEIGYAF